MPVSAQNLSVPRSGRRGGMDYGGWLPWCLVVRLARAAWSASSGQRFGDGLTGLLGVDHARRSRPISSDRFALTVVRLVLGGVAWPAARRRPRPAALALARSWRWMMFTAPAAPSTAIWEVGHAKFRSAPMALDTHHDVRAAERLAQHDGDHRHLRVGVGVDHLGAAADDAGVLLVGAGLVAGGVHEGDDGQVERVAQAHEPGDLSRTASTSRMPARTFGWLATTPIRPAVDAGEADERRRRRTARAPARIRRSRRCSGSRRARRTAGGSLVGHDGRQVAAWRSRGLARVAGVGVDRGPGVRCWTAGRRARCARSRWRSAWSSPRQRATPDTRPCTSSAAEVGHGDGLAGRAALTTSWAGDEHVRSSHWVMTMRSVRAGRYDGAAGAGAEDQAQIWGNEAAGVAGLAQSRYCCFHSTRASSSRKSL